MKIFEVINLKEESAPPFISAEELKGKDKLPVSSVKVVGTDAEDLEYNNAPIKGKLFVIGDFLNWDQQKQATHFYFKLPSGALERVNDKQLSTNIVNAMNAASPQPGVVDKVKDKVSNFFDPNNPERTGYQALQRKNADTTKTGVAVTRAFGQFDKDGAVRKLAGKGYQGLKNLLTRGSRGSKGQKPQDPYQQFYGDQPQNKTGAPGGKNTGKKQTPSKSAERQRELRRIKSMKPGETVFFKLAGGKEAEGVLRGIDPKNRNNFIVKMVDPYMPNNPNADNQKVPTHLVYKK